MAEGLEKWLKFGFGGKMQCYNQLLYDSQLQSQLFKGDLEGGGWERGFRHWGMGFIPGEGDEIWGEVMSLNFYETVLLVS